MTLHCWQIDTVEADGEDHELHYCFIPFFAKNNGKMLYFTTNQEQKLLKLLLPGIEFPNSHIPFWFLICKRTLKKPNPIH